MRRLRQISKTKIYHVMIRGNERKNIFLDNEDKMNISLKLSIVYAVN